MYTAAAQPFETAVSFGRKGNAKAWTTHAQERRVAIGQASGQRRRQARLRCIVAVRASGAERQAASLDSLRKQLAAKVRNDRMVNGGAEERSSAASSNGIDGTWGPDATGTDEALAWARHLMDLREYKRENGNCDVPVGCPGYRDLGAWVHEQRHAINATELHPRRLKLLQDIGFDDSGAKDAAWASAAAKLEVYMTMHGHSDVPLDCPQLGIWVYRQRQFHAAGILETERVARLDRIGFSWH